MARTPSTMLPLGTPMPNATLPDGAGKLYHLNECTGDKGTLVMFICNHCPFVIHIADFLQPLQIKLQALGISCVAISSNDVESYPADSPDKMVEFAAKYQLDFPYLYDENQDVARAYEAACTPDFFLFDGNGKLSYRGQLDGSRPGNDEPVNGADLVAAAAAISRGQEPSAQQLPSLGCNIKWKK